MKDSTERFIPNFTKIMQESHFQRKYKPCLLCEKRKECKVFKNQDNNVVNCKTYKKIKLMEQL